MEDESGEILAVKEVVAAPGKQRAINALRLELDTLRQLRHPNIVRYRGMLIREDKLCVAMEFCSGGSLATILAKFGTLDDVVARRYTSQILSGLEYLHRHCIVHRDIKCPNCLLGTDGVVKLADFGASKKLHALCTSSLQGTAQYIAPEILKREKVGRQSDIWSVGCCVLEMYTLSLPFSGQFSNDFSLMYTMANMKEPPKVPNNIPVDAQGFIRECFALNPAKRPSAVCLRKHDFFLNFVDDVRIQPGIRRQDLEASDKAERQRLGAGSDDVTPSAAAASFSSGPATSLSARGDAGGGSRDWGDASHLSATGSADVPASASQPGGGAESLGSWGSRTPRGAHLGTPTAGGRPLGVQTDGSARGGLLAGSLGNAPHDTAAAGAGGDGFDPSRRGSSHPGPHALPHAAPSRPGVPGRPPSSSLDRPPPWTDDGARAPAAPPPADAASEGLFHRPSGRWQRPPSSDWRWPRDPQTDDDSESEGSSGSDLDDYPAAKPDRLLRDRGLLGSRFADPAVEARYRATWMRETAQAVRGSWTWAGFLIAGGAIDVHTAWTLGGGRPAAVATTAVWGVIWAVQIAMRLQAAPAGAEGAGAEGAGVEGVGAEGGFWATMAWVRLVEAMNLALICVHSSGGNLLAVMRIVLLTYTGGHLKISLGEHALLLALFAGARLLQVAALVVLRPGALPPELEGALWLVLPERRDESLTSTVMLQTVSVFASAFYAMRAHEEARSRFAMTVPT
jgi:hypothetical protein